ncbi:MAG: hypothetical protein QM744_00005, partial [Mesorhizobium sp.]
SIAGMNTTEIYLDTNATTPVCADARAAARGRCRRLRQSEQHAQHRPAGTQRAWTRPARLRARVLGADTGAADVHQRRDRGHPDRRAVGAVRAARRRDAGVQLLLYGATEHKAVPESAGALEPLLGLGLTLHALPVDANGRHDLAALRALAPRAAMVCTMAANNETGVSAIWTASRP